MDRETEEIGERREKRVADAQWMLPDEAAARFPFQPGAFWIGRDPLNSDNAIGFNDDRHILLVAGTRSGKGRAVIVNNLALWPGSVVSIDPKGENAMLTANRRGAGSDYCDGLGQDVYVLDPFNTVDEARIGDELRAYYNPLADMDADDPELPRFAARIAESMMFNINKNDPSWDKKGGSMIEALIMHVKTSSDFEENERNLVTVRRLLMAGDTKAIEALKAHGIDELPSPIEMLWQAVVENPACDGILSDMGSSFLHSCRSNMRYFDSVKTSAEDHTKWIDSRGMRSILSGENTARRTFSLDELKENAQGISVYLCLPQADMPTYARWQRMMIDLMVAAMQKTQTKPANGHRVLFCLDEFAGLGKMDRVRTASAEAAGAGVKLFIAVQGLGQLEEVYEKGWETFVGNAGLQLYFDLKDNFTLEYLQKALGETEVVRTTQTTSESTTRQTTTGTSESVSRGTSETTSRGGQAGWSKGKSGGTNKSSALNQGGNRTWSRNEGSSRTKNFGPWSFFSFNFEGRSAGTNWGSSRGGGSNWGRSRTSGENRGWSEGSSGGRNWSQSTAESVQHQSSTQHSESEGESSGTGTSQSVHKRSLLTFDEANKLFSRIDDSDHPAYPGFIVARVAGQDPMIVRRANYDQDSAFVRCFDPHPDHEFIPWKHPHNSIRSLPNPPYASSDQTRRKIALELEAFETWFRITHRHSIELPYSPEELWRFTCSTKYWHNWIHAWTLGDNQYMPLGETIHQGDEVQVKGKYTIRERDHIFTQPNRNSPTRIANDTIAKIIDAEQYKYLAIGLTPARNNYYGSVLELKFSPLSSGGTKVAFCHHLLREPSKNPLVRLAGRVFKGHGGSAQKLEAEPYFKDILEDLAEKYAEALDALRE